MYVCSPLTALKKYTKKNPKKNYVRLTAGQK